MNNIYVMSDIHGEYELFLTMLDKINFSKDDKLIILGDVLDRGENPIKILEYIMETDNIEMIMGNHERMFLDYISTESVYDKYVAKVLYFRNGGKNTLNEFEGLNSSSQDKVTSYLKNLPLYKVIDNYVLVHSGINMTGIRNLKNIDEIMKKQSEEDLLWSREEFFTYRAIKDYTVIFGHTVSGLLNAKNDDESYNFTIWYDDIWEDKIGIDCGSCLREYGGQLGCLRLNDKEKFYVS